MATTFGLIRSFYGWLARAERSLRESGSQLHVQLLPPNRPTSLDPVVRISLHSLRVLKETQFEKKARYWYDLFQGIQEKGWTGDVLPIDVDRARLRRELEEPHGQLAV